MAGLLGTTSSASTAILTSRPISSSSTSRASVHALSFNPAWQSQVRKVFGGIGVSIKKGRSHLSITNVATEISPVENAGRRVQRFPAFNSHHCAKILQLQKTSLIRHVHCFSDLPWVSPTRRQNCETNAVFIDSPKSEDDVHPTDRLESLKNTCVALYKFTRPYSIVGKLVGAVSYSLFAVEALSDFTPMFLKKILELLIIAMFIQVFIVGYNQITDIEIDKVNKPHLPLASGELSLGAGMAITWLAALTGFFLAWRSGSTPLLWSIPLQFAMGFAYSAPLPLLRWKGAPHTAAFYIVTERVIAAIACYINAQTCIFGRAVAFTKRGLFALGMMICFLLVISFVKDIPDIEGDMKHGIRSFAARFGAEQVYCFSVWFLELAFGAAILMGLSSPITWSRYATVFGHALMGLVLWTRAKSVDLKNQEQVQEFYMFIWKLLCAEYFLLPLVR